MEVSGCCEGAGGLVCRNRGSGGCGAVVDDGGAYAELVGDGLGEEESFEGLEILGFAILVLMW